MIELTIKIRDTVLSPGQTLAVRAAIMALYSECANDEEARKNLGQIADGYRDRLAEVIRLMSIEATDTPHVSTTTTVRGSCGLIHLSMEEWRNCPICKSIDQRNAGK